jgi:F-type H+-transporting ATPase subunit delta
MQGSSRAAFVAGRGALAAALDSGADPAVLAEDLFAVTGALDSSASLRRAMVDPSRDATAKRALVENLFAPKLSAASTVVLKALVTSRWADDQDLGDATESLAVESVVALGENAGRLDALEDDLFRFTRVVEASAGLRDALSAHGGDESVKAALVETLLEGKATAEAVRLVRQAAVAPRGRRFGRILESYLAIAAMRREQLTATVTTAVALDEVQSQRLAKALSGIYKRAVQVNVVLDPAVIGGIRVQIGDEVLDGTILRRLQEAERALMK